MALSPKDHLFLLLSIFGEIQNSGHVPGNLDPDACLQSGQARATQRANSEGQMVRSSQFFAGPHRFVGLSPFPRSCSIWEVQIFTTEIRNKPDEFRRDRLVPCGLSL